MRYEILGFEGLSELLNWKGKETRYLREVTSARTTAAFGTITSALGNDLRAAASKSGIPDSSI